MKTNLGALKRNTKLNPAWTQYRWLPLYEQTKNFVLNFYIAYLLNAM